MIKIEAWSLEEAYTLASEELDCSITEIEYEVTQYPSKGFLGLGKKKAVLVAMKKVSSKPTPQKQLAPSENLPQAHQNRPQKQDRKLETKEVKTPPVLQQLQKEAEAPTIKHVVKEAYAQDRQIDDNFFREKRSVDEICEEIEIDINKLFACSCFEIDRISVEPYDDETVLISFSGQDSALLIGKEGYRYKALSYLIFNWVNSKYNLLIRLEIAEFLRNQEDMIRNYLEPLIDQIHENRRGQTKVLDGVLIQIALKALREEFADLYVGVKTNDDGSKYIIVNEFYTKQNVK